MGPFQRENIRTMRVWITNNLKIKFIFQNNVSVLQSVRFRPLVLMIRVKSWSRVRSNSGRCCQGKRGNPLIIATLTTANLSRDQVRVSAVRSWQMKRGEGGCEAPNIAGWGVGGWDSINSVLLYSNTAARRLVQAGCNCSIANGGNWTGLGVRWRERVGQFCWIVLNSYLLACIMTIKKKFGRLNLAEILK